MGIPAILAGILTQLALFSVNLRIMGRKANVAINPDNYTLLVSLRNVKKVDYPQNPILVVAAVFTDGGYRAAVLVLRHRRSAAPSVRPARTPNMSRAQGINVDFVKVLGLMLSNGLVALASALYCQYQGFADVNAGRGAIVIGLAAVIIGEVRVQPYFPQFRAAVCSSVCARCGHVLSSLFSLSSTSGLNTNDLKLITAFRRCDLPCCPVLEGQVFPRVQSRAARRRSRLTCCELKGYLQDVQRRHGQREACD